MLFRSFHSRSLSAGFGAQPQSSAADAEARSAAVGRIGLTRLAPHRWDIAFKLHHEFVMYRQFGESVVVVDSLW